jgi:primosomal protein N' (replication factor Y)
MVTKGLDFGNVSLVGILNADAIIHYPDFRAHERAFQLFVQVSGRAGRAATRGEVLIQTADPTQPIFELVANNDYQGLYEKELQERANYEYPPFVRVVTLTVKHAEQAVAETAAIRLTEELVARLARHSVLGPEQPYVNRIRNLYLYEIHIKLARQHESLRDAKLLIREAMTAVQTMPEGKGVRMVVDVDPV